MHFSTIRLENHDKPIAQLILNRPEKRNAINHEMIQELVKALSIIKEDQTRVLILKGEGAHFCAGADLAWMKKGLSQSLEENIKEASYLAALFRLLHMLPIPTIAVVTGMTLGGGLGLIACCDIVLAENQAEFCFSEAKIGLTPSVISPYIISAIGERAARYYFLTAEKINANAAQQLGLIHQVLPMENLLELSMIKANNLLKHSPAALREAKFLTNKIAEENIQMTIEHLAKIRITSEAQEGMQAFLEKRSPRWK